MLHKYRGCHVCIGHGIPGDLGSQFLGSPVFITGCEHIRSEHLFLFKYIFCVCVKIFAHLILGTTMWDAMASLVVVASPGPLVRRRRWDVMGLWIPASGGERRKSLFATLWGLGYSRSRRDLWWCHHSDFGRDHPQSSEKYAPAVSDCDRHYPAEEDKYTAFVLASAEYRSWRLSGPSEGVSW